MALARAPPECYIYGFALQELNLPFDVSSDSAAVAEGLLERLPADEYPQLAELTFEQIMKPGYEFGAEFEFGLELILDGLERVRDG